jgi:hypothetical protein
MLWMGETLKGGANAECLANKLVIVAGAFTSMARLQR